MKLATKAYLDALQAKADAMKEAVLRTESDWQVPAFTPPHIYYFANSGDDANDGLSEASPKRTLTALNELETEPGDVVLFRRGDLFRGFVNAREGVTYSAYGVGAKPTLASSMKNYADPALWEKTDCENVWKLTEPVRNAGIITFNHSGYLGDYHQKVGTKKVIGRPGFTGYTDLAADLEFTSHMQTDELWLYSEENPGERFFSIEIGGMYHTIFIRDANNITVDNLHITLTGGHGISAGTTKNLTVKNCVFDWLGGSILKGYGDGTVRFGNAVEVYGGCDGYHVYNNWMYQIYDTGITHQYNYGNTTSRNVMKNINYYDNLIEYCFWSIEYYNSTKTPNGLRETGNVHVHDNFCRFGGDGWGCPGRASSAPMYSLGITNEIMYNYVTENNIFEKCRGFLFTHAGNVAVLRNNTYVQPLGWKLARVGGEVKMFDETAPETLAAVGEKNPELVYMQPEEN